ncbi:hypothetical protein [Haliscomenobacter sp.]|uniref:hypothetical protein n=1 Tax=Haliscomenobacter sp. TaxID=2717303 RepID=UPI003BAC078F
MKKTILKSQFKSAIKRGTGQAHLILQAHPKLNVSKLIIKAALHNHSYDNQAEGSRADYVFELIQLSKHRAKIRRAIFKALAREKKDIGALDQLFNLAALYAKQGDEAARKAMYRRFYKKTIKGAELIGEEAIIEMDGLEGLKYVASVKGKIIQNDPEECDDSFMLDDFQENNPDIDVYAAFEQAAKSDHAIKIYFDTILANKFSVYKRERPQYNYSIVTEKINSGAVVPLPPVGAKELSKSDIKKLANDFLKETDRLRQEKYLRVFDRVKFPFDHQVILKIAKGKNKRKDRLIEYAVNALRYFSDPAIREFALSIIPKAKHPANYTNLLVSNYQEGDGKLLEGLVSKAKKQHKIHALVWSFVDIYKANQTKDCQAPLLALYHKMTCGVHRKEIVEILLKNEALTERILPELRYDSYAETRQLITTSL